MSVFRRMLGRQLPCSGESLLGIAYSPAESAEAHHARPYEAGLACLTDEQPGRARLALTLALELRPDFAPARLALAASLEMLARHASAAAHVERVIADNSGQENLPPRSRLLCAAGFLHERSGNWRQAARRYAAALRDHPQELFAHQRLIAIYLAHGRDAQAALHLRALLAHWPADGAARVCLAHLLQRSGRYDEAAWEYEQALCLEEDGWELPAEISLQLSGKQSAEAAAILERLVSQQPHCPDLRLRLGNIYRQGGDEHAAGEQYQRAVALNPNYLDGHIALARHHVQRGRLDEALDHFRRAIAINDQNAETYAGLALALHHSNRPGQAREILASAGRIASNSAVLLAQMALLQRNAPGEIGAAAGEVSPQLIEELITCDQTLLAQRPDWLDLRLHHGMLLRLAGRPRQSVESFQRLLLADPDCQAAWLQLGIALADLGESEPAHRALASSLKLDRRRANMAYRLGLIYCSGLEWDLALERLEQFSGDDAHRMLMLEIESMHLDAQPHPSEQAIRDVVVAR